MVISFGPRLREYFDKILKLRRCAATFAVFHCKSPAFRLFQTSVVHWLHKALWMSPDIYGDAFVLSKVQWLSISASFLLWVTWRLGRYSTMCSYLHCDHVSVVYKLSQPADVYATIASASSCWQFASEQHAEQFRRRYSYHTVHSVYSYTIVLAPASINGISRWRKSSALQM